MTLTTNVPKKVCPDPVSWFAGGDTVSSPVVGSIEIQDGTVLPNNPLISQVWVSPGSGSANVGWKVPLVPT